MSGRQGGKQKPLNPKTPKPRGIFDFEGANEVLAIPNIYKKMHKKVIGSMTATKWSKF